ncbi:MAG: phosphatidate cytidylyltransferase [Actinomycetota bacterium]|jgi:phosphatidate cytidylyltransferase|nr:phosphatidate cytidylyltransferase [Actinomycetota bacterium]
MADDDDYDEDDRPTPPRPAGEGVRIIGAQEAAAREAEMKGRLPEDSPRFGDVPAQPSGPRPAVRFPLPEDAEPPTMNPAPPDLPHWTEPATGEVPRILVGEQDEQDDLEAWSGLTSRQPRWREGSDWEEADFEDASLLAEEGERMGALDEHRPAERDVFTFAASDDGVFDDEDPDAPVAGAATAAAPRPRTTRIQTRPQEPADYGNGNGNDRDLPMAVAVGVGLAAIGLIAFARGPAWAAALATIVVVLCAVEAFDAFRRAGHRPATLLGLVATASLMIGGYYKGERAVPLVLAIAVMFTLLWYLFGVEKGRPTVNLGVSVLGLLWVGFMGSFATLMLRYPNREGVAFLLGTVIAVVANDVGALFAGRQFGNTPLAAEISPHKTWEGFAGGFGLTVLICLAIVSRIHPWGFGSALLLGVVVSIVGPLGDLCESMIKRDLGLKDMGSFIPGHGGVLDRFDAILFVLPAVYYLVELLNLAGK